MNFSLLENDVHTIFAYVSAIIVYSTLKKNMRFSDVAIETRQRTIIVVRSIYRQPTMYPPSFSNCRTSTLLAMLLFATSCSNDSGTVVGAMSPNTNNLPSAIEQAVATQQQVPFSNTFDDARITEASGIQRSLLIDSIYYVHNDSDSDPLLYTSNAAGQILGSINIINATSTDWESLAGARHDGRNKLIIADIGNNARQRQDLKLWVIDEPALNELDLGFELELIADTIALNYSDGLSYDAEGLFIDADNDTLVVLTKDAQDSSTQSIWTGSLSRGLTDGSQSLVFNGLVNLPASPFANAITGVDIHPNGRELAVLTYGPLPGVGNIHLWTPTDDEGLTDALLRPSDRMISVPLIGSNFQAEGISYSADGNTLLVGAEGLSRSALTVVAR